MAITLSVAQHRHAVADAPDLGHAMGDIDDAHALSGGALNQREQLLGFAFA